MGFRGGIFSRPCARGVWAWAERLLACRRFSLALAASKSAGAALLRQGQILHSPLSLRLPSQLETFDVKPQVPWEFAASWAQFRP